MTMRILTLDIESSPCLAHVWGLWDQNVSLSQLLESGEIICFAAKWYGKSKIYFASIHKEGKEEMLRLAYDLVDEADVIIHYNGKRFDMPYLATEWVRLGWTPPSPYAEVDLYQVIKQKFKFPSNKLDYAAGELLGEHKVKHQGHELWVSCMAGDEKAWKTMQKYNVADVLLTEKLYDRIRPWVPNLPNPALYLENEVILSCCPECMSDNLQKRGFAFTKQRKYQRYLCLDCGRWARGTSSLTGTKIV